MTFEKFQISSKRPSSNWQKKRHIVRKWRQMPQEKFLQMAPETSKMIKAIPRNKVACSPVQCPVIGFLKNQLEPRLDSIRNGEALRYQASDAIDSFTTQSGSDVENFLGIEVHGTRFIQSK
jgi:hypothetical protein